MAGYSVCFAFKVERLPYHDMEIGATQAVYVFPEPFSTVIRERKYWRTAAQCQESGTRVTSLQTAVSAAGPLWCYCHNFTGLQCLQCQPEGSDIGLAASNGNASPQTEQQWPEDGVFQSLCLDQACERAGLQVRIDDWYFQEVDVVGDQYKRPLLGYARQVGCVNAAQDITQRFDGRGQ